MQQRGVMEDDISSSEDDVMEDLSVVNTAITIARTLSSAHDSFPFSESLHVRRRHTFVEVTDPLKDCEYRRAFRMNREHFRLLVDLVRPQLVRNEQMGALRNGVVEPEVRVAIVLRITAGASDFDLMVLWGVSRPTMYSVYHESVPVFLEALPFSDFPTTPEKCVALSEQYIMLYCSDNMQSPFPPQEFLRFPYFTLYFLIS